MGSKNSLELSRREFLTHSLKALRAVFAMALVPHRFSFGPKEKPYYQRQNQQTSAVNENNNGQLTSELTSPKEQEILDGMTMVSWLNGEDGNEHIFGLHQGELKHYFKGKWLSITSADDYHVAFDPHNKNIEILVAQKNQDDNTQLFWGELNEKGTFSLIQAGEDPGKPENFSLIFQTYTNKEGEKIQFKAYCAIKTDQATGEKRAFLGSFDINIHNFVETEVPMPKPGIVPEDIEISLAENGIGAAVIKFVNDDFYPEHLYWLTSFYLSADRRIEGLGDVFFNANQQSAGDMQNSTVGISTYLDNDRKGHIWVRVVSTREATWIRYWFGPQSERPDYINDNTPFVKEGWSEKSEEVTLSTKVRKPSHISPPTVMILSDFWILKPKPKKDQRSQVEVFEFAGKQYATMIDPDLTQASVYEGKKEDWPNYPMIEDLSPAIPDNALEAKIQKRNDGGIDLLVVCEENQKRKAFKWPMIQINKLWVPAVHAN